MIAEPQTQVNQLSFVDDPRRATLHRRAVRYYKRGDDHRWVACLCAARIVGNYEPGAALALANDLSLSLSQVSNLAAAWNMYQSIRGFAPGCRLWRRALTPKHFWTMWKLMDKYGFASYEAAGYLSEAAEYHASASVMKTSVIGLHDNGKPKPRTWEAVVESTKRIKGRGWVWSILVSGHDGEAAPDGAALQIREVIE